MTQEIKTEKFEGLLVKYPDNTSDLVYPKIGMVDLYFHLNNGEYESVAIPQGKWKLLGNPFELSEAYCQLIVPLIKRVYGRSYYDYTVVYPNGTFDYVGTAKQSFNSLLKSLQVYKENPYGKPDINTEKYFPISDDEKDTLFMNDWDKWEEAEERTGNWIILEKL